LTAAVLALVCLNPASAADDAGAPSAGLIRPLLIGATAPDVTLATGDGEPFSLGDALSRKPSIVVFYRGGW
jgi:hypothetical protein